MGRRTLARSAWLLLLLLSRPASAQVHELQALPRFAAPQKPAPRSALHKIHGGLLAADRARAAAAGPWRPLAPARTASGRLRVTVRLSAATDPSALAAAGLDVEQAPAGAMLVQGSIDPPDLPRVAALGAVASIDPLHVPIHRIGRATTEGDAASGADAVRELGLDGAGVTVGIISDGIDSLVTAQGTGDLGTVTVPADGRCRRGSGDEGTALAEIVHDIAPGATLLFSGPSTDVEMINTVRCLTAVGANVIVDDLGFPFEPYFEDGPVASAVRQAVRSGVSYHAAAGNEGDEYLETDFAPTPGSAHHDFRASNGASVDNTDTVVVPPGSLLLCVLQWGDRFGATGDDYDLYLLDDAMNVIDAGTDTQAGRGDPLEFVAAANISSTDRTAHLVIDRVSGEARPLKLSCSGADTLEYATPTGSIFGHAALPEVVAVGAVDQAAPGRLHVEDFSSRGPFQLLFPASAVRPKPDLVALDGVSISNAGGFPSCPPSCRFFGTSAAAPHSAGVAALMLQRSPGLSPAALQDTLKRGATDIETPGFDALSGAGLLNALASVTLLPSATTSTTVPTPTTTSTTLPTSPAPGPAPTTATRARRNAASRAPAASPCRSAMPRASSA